MLLQELFSQWLRKTRTSKGISHRGVKLVSASGVKALEDSAHDPRLTTYVNLCHAMGENPGLLLNRLLKDAEVKS